MEDGKIPCTKCGAKILRATAENTGGYCMPCLKARARETGQPDPHGSSQSDPSQLMVGVLGGMTVALILLWYFWPAFHREGWGILLVSWVALNVTAFGVDDFVKKQKRRGVNAAEALLVEAGRMLMAGTGGGISFLSLNYLGVPVYTFPNFKRFDTSGIAWYWIFAFGFLTGLALEAARAIRHRPAEGEAAKGSD